MKEAAEIVLSDPRTKDDYKNYLKACDDYNAAAGIDGDISYDKLEEFENEILSLDYHESNFKTDPEDEKDKIKDKVISGAKKLKDEFNLKPKLDVNYKEYTKQNRDEIKYLIKNMIFDLVDEMYFSAK